MIQVPPSPDSSGPPRPGCMPDSSKSSPQPSHVSESSGSSFYFHHSRSQSQNQAVSPVSASLSSPGSYQPIRHDRPPSSWTQLIPPMPNQPSSHQPSPPPDSPDEFDFSTSSQSPPVDRQSYKPQRHSIAISPSVATNINDPLNFDPKPTPNAFNFYTQRSISGEHPQRPPPAPPIVRGPSHSFSNSRLSHTPAPSSPAPEYTPKSTIPTITTTQAPSEGPTISQQQPPVKIQLQKQQHTPLATPPQSLTSTPDLRPKPSVHASSSVVPQMGAAPPPAPVNLGAAQRKRSVRKKSRKVCKACSREITGQFVRALNSPFHVECFRCYECDNQCSAKFFPYELIAGEEKSLVALCEYDYFKKLDLICFNCNKALRGPYITALGNKYHLEHFKCAVCLKVFEADESYYEHDNNIYCHFHYSRSFASKCEGCHSSIVKQFVELYRGGRNQQWHPECYMVHKFWNVSIDTDQVGLLAKYGITNPHQVLQELSSGPDILPNNQVVDADDAKLLFTIESQIESVVMQCWLTLSGYEEATAANISDMLLNAHIANQANGILATGKLILNVEILFNALDAVLKWQESQRVQSIVSQSTPTDDGGDSSTDATDGFHPLRKEPRNISGKIMSYLAILRKSSHISQSGTLSTELLSVITGCAHYLKLLMRIGLYNALKVNSVVGSTEATDSFLGVMREFEHLGTHNQNNSSNDRVNSPMDDHKVTYIAQKLVIPVNSTDACVGCHKSIEKSCVRNREHNKRWHHHCFNCVNCGRPIPQQEYNMAGYDTTANAVHCRHCVEEHKGGFDTVTDLQQLVYLLKIALARSRSAMKVNYGGVQSEQRVIRQPSNKNDHAAEAVEGYTKTLDDVTRLRARRQSHKLSTSIKQNARRSVIVEAPEADKARRDSSGSPDISELTVGTRIPSQTSLLSYNPLTPEDDQFALKNDHRQILKIRDEDVIHQVHLDRTTDMLKNEKSLTLDDIPRIVAAEQAREQRPNAFKHHNSLYKRSKPLKPVRAMSEKEQVSPTRHFDELMGQGPEPAPEITKKSKYYSELTKDEHFILRHIAIEAFSRSFGRSRDELLPMIQTKKPPTFWEKFRFGGGDKSGSREAGVFGLELVDLTNRYGTDSDLGVGPCKLRIPIFIDDIISALKQKDMSVEGIFRLNGNIKKLREMTEEINKHPESSPDFGHQNAVQLAALMKKWLRELPNPLLTTQLYELWIMSQHQPSAGLRKRVLSLCYCMLPRSHRNLVEVLLYFFSWVASFAEIDDDTGSKMDTHNLATVIAPNVLFAKPTNSSGQDDGIHVRGEGFFYAIEVLNNMIEQHEELSMIPDDLLAFYNRCGFEKTENLSTKEICAKIDKALKDEPCQFEQVALALAQDDDDDEESDFPEVRSSAVARGNTQRVEQQPRIE